MEDFQQKYIYPFTGGKSSKYFRYINDIFLIWAGTKNELNHFLKDLNKKHSSIKSDNKVWQNCITFLILKYILRKRKESDRQYYSFIISYHLKSLKDSLLNIKAIQIKRISSNQVDLNNRLKEMKNNFAKHGYHSPLIKLEKKNNLLNRTNLIMEKDFS